MKTVEVLWSCTNIICLPWKHLTSGMAQPKNCQKFFQPHPSTAKELHKNVFYQYCVARCSTQMLYANVLQKVLHQYCVTRCSTQRFLPVLCSKMPYATFFISAMQQDALRNVSHHYYAARCSTQRFSYYYAARCSTQRFSSVLCSKMLCAPFAIITMQQAAPRNVFLAVQCSKMLYATFFLQYYAARCSTQCFSCSTMQQDALRNVFHHYYIARCSTQRFLSVLCSKMLYATFFISTV